jgi:4-alpha-glucanotransferase
MTRDRVSGVLVHPTSFPGPHGIGDLGPAAFRFVDWLAQAGQRRWQLMPLGPTGLGDSPYASPSAFAGNPLLVSLEWLGGEGLLRPEDFGQIPEFHDWEVDFGAVIRFKQPLLRRAYQRFAEQDDATLDAAFREFRHKESSWLEDFAIFQAAKTALSGTAWWTWDEALRRHEPVAIERARLDWADEIAFHQFVQFQFRRQWTTLKRYANERSIRIIGDIPIFVALDSSDVWANQAVFRLDVDGHPTTLAGVPPDYFSPTGQLWGNPHYDWHYLERTGFAWWIDRVKAILAQVDIVRVDHFRGFAAAWAIPYDAEDAKPGEWQKAPGADLFAALRARLGDVPFIAEDLGIITEDVETLRRELGIPGMRVLQFAFGDGPDNLYLPHNYEPETVAYTATHDNETTVGWFHNLSDQQRQEVQRYLGRDGSDIAWELIRIALSSVADTAIFPLQDIMRLGDEGRMNTPGRLGGNWGWRYQEHQLHAGLAAGLGELTAIYGRRLPVYAEREYDPYDYTAPDTAHPLRS